MLGILFIYFIGKFFYKLAEKYNKNKWLFGILGVAMYYLGSLIGGVILGVISLLFDFEIDWDNSTLMTVIAIPFGFGACWLFHYLLEFNWEKHQLKSVINLDEIGKNIED